MIWPNRRLLANFITEQISDIYSDIFASILILQWINHFSILRCPDCCIFFLSKISQKINSDFLLLRSSWTQEPHFPVHLLVKFFSIFFTEANSISVVSIQLGHSLWGVETRNISWKIFRLLSIDGISLNIPSTEYHRRNIDGDIMFFDYHKVGRNSSSEDGMNHQCSHIFIYQGKILCWNSIPSSYDRWMHNILCKALRM